MSKRIARVTIVAFLAAVAVAELPRLVASPAGSVRAAEPTPVEGAPARLPDGELVASLVAPAQRAVATDGATSVASPEDLLVVSAAPPPGAPAHEAEVVTLPPPPPPPPPPRAAPAVDASSFVVDESVWDALAQCESGGNWSINTGNGYYGGLQFSYDTWHASGGGAYAEYPHQATREEQIAVAENLHAARGFAPWPACRVKLGLP